MDQVGTLLNRPKFYNNIDGLVELGASVMFLGFALVLRLLMHSPADSVWHRISWFAFVGLLLLIHYGTKAVKTRITYPRTGFVAYRSPWHTRAIPAALGALASAVLVVALHRRCS